MAIVPRRVLSNSQDPDPYTVDEPGTPPPSTVGGRFNVTDPHQPTDPNVPPGAGPQGNRVTPVEQKGTNIPTSPLVTPRSNATPGQPQEPTPVASGPPQPFSPMPSPIVRRGISAGGPNSQSSMLLGKAGGLLAGGLGVPGVVGGQDSTDIADLIASLYKMANQ